MRVRFNAKQLGRQWAVYDTLKGSWPVQVAGFGFVGTEGDYDTEEEAQREADRLEHFYRTEKSRG